MSEHTDIKRYPVKTEFSNAWINKQRYESLYKQSIENPDVFWKEQAEQFVTWRTPFSKIKNTRFTKNDVSIKWFEDGELNVSENCLDRHLAERADQIALIWEANEPDNVRKYTYQQVHDEVCKLANALRELGIGKGDVVCIYLPMIPEALFSMLACARIGAVHSVIFAGFSSEAIAGRITDSSASLVITADTSNRGSKTVHLKNNVDEAVANPAVTTIKNVLVVKHSHGLIDWNDELDIDYAGLVNHQAPVCEAEVMNAEDPLFILYTSGSTGKPKGLVHTCGGYLVWACMTFKYVYDYQDKDVFWCSADVGWITGHTYVVYGPLASGATTLMFEGIPNYPAPNRCAQIIDTHHVTTLYTAPTAIRALMADSDQAVEGASLKSLRLLAAAGEPINPEAWHWFYEKIGKAKCPIMDTWWQTETGGNMITPLPGVTTLKPGSATQPFFGIQPALIDVDGNPVSNSGEGSLVIKDSWPGQARTIYGDHQRFQDTYFSAFENVYFTGDGAKRDEDGDYWITGRVDDVLNVSGHRLGTAELESELVAHPCVAEAAVVGFNHSVKGQGVYAYVSLMAGSKSNVDLVKELHARIRKGIGAIAMPDFIQITQGLPKTRSGKIMRRILRKIANNEHQDLGDISTLAEPEVVEALIQGRLNKG